MPPKIYNNSLTTRNQNIINWYVAIFIGAGLGCLSFIGNAYLALAAFAAITSITFMALLRPGWLLYLFVTLIIILEEYPATFYEKTRWIRTFFYSHSTGLPGFYPYDIFFLIILMVTLLYFISNPIEPKLPYQINLPIFYFTGIIILSTSISLLLQTLTHQPVYDVSNIGFAFKGPAIYLIGFSQTKIFLYLFLTLFITYISLRDKKQIYDMFIVLLLSIAISMLQGLWRLFLHPENYIKIGIPIFYDSASSMFFMFFIIAFIILNIFEIPLNRIARISMTLFSIIGMLLIIFSFRRTIWLSFGVLLFLFPFLPLPNKKIWLRRFAGLIILIVGLLFISHFNSNHTIQLPTSIENRMQATTLGESSTLYRYVMYKEAFPLIMESPIIGHGIEPLWNNYLVYGKFKQSYENIHSLYLWILFRWGIAGLLCFCWIIWRCYRLGLTALFKCPLNRLDAAILWIILLSLGGFLITALFFPVYSMMRFVVIAGVLLAMELKLVSLQTVASKATAA